MPCHLKKIVSVCLVLLSTSGNAQPADAPSTVEVSFPPDSYSFSKAEQQRILDTVERTEKEVRGLLTELPEKIQISVSTLDRDLSSVGGITGSADDPNSISVLISTSYEGGVNAAVDTGLAAVLFHEFHHLARGWTIKENRFGPGILVAAVNEGLANVFSEIYTDTAFAGNAYPANANEWLEEIRNLPNTASYSQWMVEHRDGRQAIGYKAGSYLVRRILESSDLSILELSELPVEDILKLADTVR